MEMLKTTLQKWCLQHGMKVSEDKTQIITPRSTKILTITNDSDDETYSIKAVNNYSYLGILGQKTI